MANPTFGQWLKQARTAHEPRISQLKLSELTGIDRGYLSRMENGKVGLPLEETRQRIHAALGTSDADITAFGVPLKEDYGSATVLPGTALIEGSTATATAGALSGRVSGSSRASGNLSIGDGDDAPLTPEEQAILADAFFTGLNNMTPRKLRELIRVIQERE